MKVVYLIIVLLHGLIHGMGVVKGSGIKDIKELTLPISKPMAVLWLLAFVVTVVYGILFLMQHRYAWALGFLAVIVSQLLVFMYWQDAKFGTVANILILLVSVVQLGQFQFKKKVNQERDELIQAAATDKQKIVTEADLRALPFPVQKWLRGTGVIGRPMANYALMSQEAEMKMQPDQEDWLSATAVQFTDLQEPVLHWVVDAKMNSVLGFSGRDQFVDGKGQMLIKLNGLIPVVNESGPKMDEGTAQRYLGELVWFPSLALSSYINWEEVDSTSAKATLNYAGNTCIGTYRFNEQGDFVQFSTMRYKGNEPDAARHEWVLDVQGYQEFRGIRIPSEMTATWKLPEGDWTWLKLKITEVNYY